MTKWADYGISRMSWNPDAAGRRVLNTIVHEDRETSISDGEERPRAWVIDQLSRGKSFTTIRRTRAGKWARGSPFTIRPGEDLLTWEPGRLPLINPRRKVFTSFFHREDVEHRDAFQNLTGDIAINKSVGDNEISTDVADTYIKELIQREYLHDVTVLAVIVGPRTYGRKHVDWEIAGALDYRVGDKYAGLLGILLPSHPSFATPLSPKDLPRRLAANVESGYAPLVPWSDDPVDLQAAIEDAFDRRTSKASARVNRSVPQMQRNLFE